MEKKIEINLIRLLRQLTEEILPNAKFDSERKDLLPYLHFLINNIKNKETCHLDEITHKTLINSLHEIKNIRNQDAHIEDTGGITTEKELHDLLKIKFFVEYLEKLFPSWNCTSFIEELRVFINVKMNTLLEIYNFPEVSSHSLPAYTPIPDEGSNQPDIIPPPSNDTYTDLFFIDLQKPNFTETEARERLINLRGPIVHKYPTTPREEGILRRSLIDLYIKKKITSEAAFHKLGNLHIDSRQMEFLPQILDIISKINYKTI